MSLTFYDCSTAPSPRRARIALLEKGVSYETVEIDLAKGEHLGEAYKAVNPLSTVPALKVSDETVLIDNAGIIAWLDAAHPEPPLLGTTPEERAMVASWSSRVEFEGLLAIAEALRNFAPQMKGRALPGPENYEQIPALVERGVARLQHFWKRLDNRLEGREFLASEQFSWADISALVTVDFSKVIQQRPDESHANIWRWRHALDERGSVNQTNLKKRG